MARKLRVEYPGAIYHVMNRGHRHELILHDDADRDQFLATLGEACQKAVWEVHAFCLMPIDPLLARDLVRLCPDRAELRAVKRRPKPYPLLNQSRRCFQEISHRSRYWKGRTRNYRGLN